MSFFITEKETEKWLEPESRDIAMPDGSKRSIEMFKLAWRSFDFLTVCQCYTAKELIELSIKNADEMGYSFEDSFPNVLAYLHRDARKKMGID
jgi:hypothetical protein